MVNSHVWSCNEDVLLIVFGRSVKIVSPLVGKDLVQRTKSPSKAAMNHTAHTTLTSLYNDFYYYYCYFFHYYSFVVHHKVWEIVGCVRLSGDFKLMLLALFFVFR